MGGSTIDALKVAAELQRVVQETQFSPDDAAARLLDEHVPEETYEQFMSSFSGGIVKQAKPPAPTPTCTPTTTTPLPAFSTPASLTKEALYRLQNAKEEKKDEDHVSSIHEGSCTTVSIGAGTTSSILDAGNAALQSGVKFDNYVEDLDPDDISDLSNYEWEDFNKPKEPTRTATPPNTPAIPSPNVVNPKRVQFGPEVPFKRTYATDYPEVSAEREGEGALREKMRSVQTVGLPPGWKIDAATLRSLPPHADNSEALRKEAEQECSAEKVQQLHHTLLSANNSQHDDDISNLTPLTDADVFLKDETAKFEADPNIAPEYLKQMNNIDHQLYSTLNVPRDQTKNCSQQENAFNIAKSLQIEELEEENEGGGGGGGESGPNTATPDPVYEDATATEPPAGEVKWEEELKPFSLDPSFDYDNIDETKLTPKPKSPWEV